MEKRVVRLQRHLRLVGSPFFLPPGVPTERARILQDAFRKAYRDPEFSKGWKKVAGEEPNPLLPEEQQEVVREIPRDPEVIKVSKRIAGADPLPPR